MEQGPANNDIFFMQEAFKQALRAIEQNEVPVGCVITLNNKIIAKAYNQVETLKDPTAHAEMIAITQAANTISSKWLHDCVMYVTLEPCSMCSGAMVLSRIKRLIFGARDPKAGACGSALNIIKNQELNHRIDWAEGILADESSALLSDFFRKKRVEQQRSNHVSR